MCTIHQRAQRQIECNLFVRWNSNFLQPVVLTDITQSVRALVTLTPTCLGNKVFVAVLGQACCNLINKLGLGFNLQVARAAVQ